MKRLLYTLFGLLYALVTFFGIGPVLFADGAPAERVMTLAAVLLIYVLLTLVLRALLRRLSKR
ncbi:hypothetical protein R70723_11200 [Paenibacillus sp. FSL R7-0273]|uniref:DUF6954 family protein n=1 Tax=Paenibacillus sp. FSL R7-0273 TaxID=1536772 RepID=UPI0004F7E6CC|nr:hypothetical protein [Paenibacillus sp. FSL R7-0273]AIQ46378.1 hypothetical protein R70723_11200 [Paenibacillus sp. FSL R7-0273]OMF85713.1 hypothetical protein BK144_27525 [Paenibacillus sp. FSL R7-0273]